MEENFNEGIEKTETPSRAKRFRLWLDNYIYHYKWHTIVALFLIFAITICTVQMCDKESYDIYVIYAGGYDISKLKTDENEVEFVSATRALESIAGDYNDDGKIKIALDSLYMLTSEEAREKQAEYDERFAQNPEEFGNERPLVPTQKIQSNFNTMDMKMLQSEYFVCIMSSEIYKYYSAKNPDLFTSLDKYVDDGTTVHYFGNDKRAIYLNSTNAKTLPVLQNLPEDTVIALRTLSELGSFGEKYEYSEQYIRSMINSK